MKNNTMPRFDNTLRVKIEADNMDWDWYVTPTGNDKFIFEIGDEVITTTSSTFKPGIKLVVKDRFIECGWAKYFAGGVWHRQNDLVKIVKDGTK